MALGSIPYTFFEDLRSAAILFLFHVYGILDVLRCVGELSFNGVRILQMNKIGKQ